MREMLELSDWLFKIITIDVLKTLIEKVNYMQDHMDIISREMGSLRMRRNRQKSEKL